MLAVIANPWVSSTLQRFDVRTGRSVGGGHVVSNRLVTMEVAGDGRSVVTSSPERDVVVRDTSTWRTLRRWPVRAAAAALSPDGRTLLTGDAEGAVRFLDLDTGTLRLGAGGHDGAVVRGEFSLEYGKLAITAGADPGMIAWDAARASAGETLGGHAGQVTGLAFSDDGGTLYSSSMDGKVLVSDLEGSRLGGRPFAIPRKRDGPRFSLRHDGREARRSGTTTGRSR